MGKVKSIHENQYTISDNTARNLLDLGFKYDSTEEKYIYNFAVLKYEKMTVIHGRITAYTDTNEIQIDVTDNNNAPYAPFYNIECGSYDIVLNKVNKAILNEFGKLKIKYKNGKKDEKYENQFKKTNRNSNMQEVDWHQNKDCGLQIVQV